MKLFFSTFLLMFLAELGDKTQITTFAGAGKGDNLISVIIGAVGALWISALLAVFLGDRIATRLPKRAIRIASGLIFLGYGLFFLIKNIVNFHGN